MWPYAAMKIEFGLGILNASSITMVLRRRE